MKKIKAYEFVNHGIENEQYFQGCGVSFTEFITVMTGTGCNYFEALNDALDGLADKWNLESNAELLAELAEIQAKHGNDDMTIECGDDVYYYASIRVR
jgi:hypothetical protein